MKTFKNQAAQGDMLIRRIDKLPADAVAAKSEGADYVLAHSETGHNHVVKKKPGVEFYQHANDNFIAWLVVDNTECLVEHMRGFDTHETIKFPPGIYEIRRQREYIPEGFRRAAD
jgi:hypothetical protein